MILTSKEKHLVNNSSIYFDRCSVNLSSSQTLYLVLDSAPASLLCKLTGQDFSLYTIENLELTKRDQVDLTNVEHLVLSGKQVYKINVMFLPSTEGEKSGQVTIQYDDQTFEFNLFAEAIEIDSKLLINLQNMKKFISEDYMTAFRQSVNGASTFDNVLYNQKMKEYLVNIFEFSALHGSYKSLLSVIEFFGYGELLTLKEYWTSNGQYKSTSIMNSVMSKIDKQLIGFKKTNQMSLVYQINQANGIDEDGLPIYSNVFENTDEILTKLYALERVIEKDFMFINTHIVDIVGEFQTAAALELNFWLNDATITNVNLTSNIGSVIEYAFAQTSIPYVNHRVLLKPWAWSQGASLVPLENEEFAIFDENYFNVEKIAEDFQQDDMLTRYYNGDFGLIDLAIRFDESVYQSYKYLLYDLSNDELVFESELFDISTMNNRILCGVRGKLGQFKMVVYMIDWYGGSSIVGIPEPLTIYERPVDFFIGKYDTDGEIEKNLELYTTFQNRNQESNSIGAPDPYNFDLDIMTWNQTTNVPYMLLSKFYSGLFDQYSTYTNLRQLNSIPLWRMNGLPLHTWGHKYAVSIIDIVGNADTGVRLFGMREFSHEAPHIFARHFQAGTNPMVFVSEYVSEINKFCQNNPDHILSRFNWSLHFYSNDPDGTISDARPMIMAKSKESSFPSRMMDIYFNNFYSHSDFHEGYFKHDVEIWSKIDANIQFGFNTSVEGTLQMYLDDVSFIYQNFTPTNIQDVYIAIRDLFTLQKDVTVSVINDTIIIYSERRLRISHPSIGTFDDSPRGKDSSMIKRIPLGSDIKLGEPFFAFIDSADRIALSDTTWTLKNALTGSIVTVQKSYAFRWIVSEVGSYTLELTGKQKSGPITTIKQGCIVVQ